MAASTAAPLVPETVMVPAGRVVAVGVGVGFAVAVGVGVGVGLTAAVGVGVGVGAGVAGFGLRTRWPYTRASLMEAQPVVAPTTTMRTYRARSKSRCRVVARAGLPTLSAAIVKSCPSMLV